MEEFDPDPFMDEFKHSRVTLESDSRGEGVIIYIHGFGGSGVGNKASLFREYFKERGVELYCSISFIYSRFSNIYS